MHNVMSIRNQLSLGTYRTIHNIIPNNQRSNNQYLISPYPEHNDHDRRPPSSILLHQSYQRFRIQAKYSSLSSFVIVRLATLLLHPKFLFAGNCLVFVRSRKALVQISWKLHDDVAYS